MASIYDIETRAAALAKKYAAFDEDAEQAKAKRRERPADAFEELYQQMEDSVDALAQKAEAAQAEKSRAVVAQVNAEVRRGKAQLRTDLARLHKLAKKRGKAARPAQSSLQGATATNNPMCQLDTGGGKQNHRGLTPEELEDRHQRLAELEQRIEAIADGVRMQAPDRKGKGPLNPLEIRIDTVAEEPGGAAGKDASYYEQTEHSKAFRAEFELAKQRQDKDLDEISRGVGKLRDLAAEMGEEMTKQDDLIDTMETKVDQNNADIRTVNSKLRHTLTSIRSSRNFCMDVTLICIVLAIGAYIYSIFA